MRTFAIFLALSAVSIFGSGGKAAAQGSPPSLGAAIQSTPIGKVVTTNGSVTIVHADAVLVQVSASADAGQVKAGDPVYLRDTVQTAADSAVGIVFADGTAFNLAANSRMVLDEFVYDPKGSANSTAFSVARGTFTFITGKVAATGQMRVHTPVATMGIRGTSPHVEILDNGTVKFSTLVEEGSRSVVRRSQASPQQASRPAQRRTWREGCRSAAAADSA